MVKSSQYVAIGNNGWVGGSPRLLRDKQTVLCLLAKRDKVVEGGSQAGTQHT